ncbi:MAG: histidine phosphatase family protein [Clostridia bacterium]|nr:histidine phosphatase family protein [Clostridia bacterium]
MLMEPAKIYVIRHGETSLNAKAVMQGRLDEPLNESGRELAAITGREMRGIRFDGCVSSPLIRATETAEILLLESENRIPVMTDERLLEIDFGSMEGRKLTDLGEGGIAFFREPFRFDGFPGGESIKAVCLRTQAFFRDLISRIGRGQTWLVSTHGCALRAMLNPLYDDPSDFWQGHAPYNCAVAIVDVKDGIPRILESDRIYYPSDLAVDRFRKAKE